MAIAFGLGGSAGAARAADGGGIIEFFQQQFGGGSGANQALPQPDYSDPYAAPPLTVRQHPKRHAFRPPSRTPQETLAAIRDTTIYNDKTLERGDAVMTRNGMRIFNGSSSWPYTDTDFVALSETKVAPSLRKELSAMDVASRADAAR